jgi:hypothetical protein
MQHSLKHKFAAYATLPKNATLKFIKSLKNVYFFNLKGHGPLNLKNKSPAGIEEIIIFFIDTTAKDTEISHGPTTYSKEAGRGRRYSSVGTLRLFQKDKPRTRD